MKFKEILYAVGIRPKPQEFGHEIVSFRLPKDGEIQFARWLHPGVVRRPYEITQKEVDDLRKFLKPGDAAIDIGTQYGDSTVPIALAVGATGVVFALEPNPYAYKVMAVNAGLNRDKTHIVPLNFAATPEDGEFVFRYSDPGFGNGGLNEGISAWDHASFYKIKVQGRNLVRYLKTHHAADIPRIRFIKMDTEGQDHPIAESLRELIVSNKPYIHTEFFTYRTEPERLAYYRFLRDLGYRMFKTEAGNVMSAPIGEADLMRWRHMDVFCVPEGAEPK